MSTQIDTILQTLSAFLTQIIASLSLSTPTPLLPEVFSHAHVQGVKKQFCVFVIGTKIAISQNLGTLILLHLSLSLPGPPPPDEGEMRLHDQSQQPMQGNWRVYGP